MNSETFVNVSDADLIRILSGPPKGFFLRAQRTGLTTGLHILVKISGEPVFVAVTEEVIFPGFVFYSR